MCLMKLLKLYRDPKEFLAKDRVSLLNKNKEILKQLIDLEQSIILDYLVGDANVLTTEEKQSIDVSCSLKLNFHNVLRIFHFTVPF